jgi:hypothetical protein
VRSHRLASRRKEDHEQSKDINEPSSVMVILLNISIVLRFNVMLCGYGPRLNIFYFYESLHLNCHCS